MEFHPISELEAKMKPETLAKARKLYEQESLSLKLKELRGKYEAGQGGPKRGVRKDMSVSALSDYLKSLGMGMEIVALPGGKKRELLLRV